MRTVTRLFDFRSFTRFELGSVVFIIMSADVYVNQKSGIAINFS